MKRNMFGYLDIEEYFKRTLKTDELTTSQLKNKRLVEEATIGTSADFWFYYQNKKVLYKKFRYEENCYSELFSEEIAKHLDISHASYDLATFKNNKGLISYDFKNNNYIYIPLFYIIRKYINSLKLDKDKISYYRLYNNLEDIWNALIYFFKEEFELSNEQINHFVAKLMIELTDYFCFQIISGNYDMHSSNITIGVDPKKNDVYLVPLYDNEDMFKIVNNILYELPNTPQLGVTRKSIINKVSIYKMLETYLTISDEYFINRLTTYISKLNFETTELLFKRIEKKTNAPMPHRIKHKLREAFNEHIQIINDILNSTYKKTR